MKLKTLLFSSAIATSLFAADCDRAVISRIEKSCDVKLSSSAQNKILNAETCVLIKGDGNEIQNVLFKGGEELLTVSLKTCARNIDDAAKVYSLRSEGGVDTVKGIYQKLFYVTKDGQVNFMDQNRNFFELTTSAKQSYKTAKAISYKNKVLTIETEKQNIEINSNDFDKRAKKEIRKRAIRLGKNALGGTVTKQPNTNRQEGSIIVIRFELEDTRRDDYNYFEINKLFLKAADALEFDRDKIAIFQAGIKASDSYYLDFIQDICSNIAFTKDKLTCYTKMTKDPSNSIYTDISSAIKITSKMCQAPTFTSGKIKCYKTAANLLELQNNCSEITFSYDVEQCYKKLFK